jgi:hypothetical protein
MRLLLFILGVLAAIVCIEKPAEAGSWCAYYDFGANGATNCGFSTYQQCLATVSGVGGSCGANPQYQGSPGYICRLNTPGAILIKRPRLAAKAPAGDIGCNPPRLATAEKEIMATVSKLIFGVAIAAVSVATPALAQHASQSDPLISAHHRQHLRVSSPPSDSPAFTSPPRDPRSWVGDPASRPYHYDPEWGGGP